MVTVAAAAHFAGLAIAVGALVRETWGLRAPGTLPIARLARRELRASEHDALRVGACVVAGVLLVALPTIWYVALGGARLEREPVWRTASILTVAATVTVKVAWVVFEELAFRAALISVLARRMAIPIAVVASAVAFAAAHGRDPASTAVLVIDGVGYGVAYVATRSIRAPVAWHAGKNLTVWLVTGQGTMQLAPSPWRLVSSVPTSGALEILCASAVVAVTSWLLVRRRPPPRLAPR